MNITAIQIAHWLQADRGRQLRLERRQQFYYRVRRACAFVFGATAIVLAFSYRQEIQNFTSAGLGKAIDKTGGSDQIRQGADDYAKQVDKIAQ
jgi:hypothetical protein